MYFRSLVHYYYFYTLFYSQKIGNRPTLYARLTSLNLSVHFEEFSALFFVDFSVLLPRDASAERGNATVSRLSVCLSVCLSVTFRYQQHIGWNSWKIISRPNSLRPLLGLTPNMGDLVQREHPQN